MRFSEILQDRLMAAEPEPLVVSQPRPPGVKLPDRPIDKTKPRGVKALAGLKR